MIAGIILAAGMSTRMGRTKALLPLGDRTFLSQLLVTFESAGVEEIVVVLGHDSDRVRAAHAGMRARFAVNPNFEQGQLSSLLTGIAVIDRPGVEAALVTLVDVPLVAPATVAAVIERYRQTRLPIVRPVQGDRHGHPVLYDRSLFAELRRADPAHGSKPVVRRYASADGDVVVDDAGAFDDVDTPAEYDRVALAWSARNQRLE